MAARATRVRTQRELNRALLARQLLLERGTGTVPKTLERIGGIQAQYAPSMYIGLWSRLEGFERDDLTRALERRSVVQGTMMRATIQVVSNADYWPFVMAVRAGRRQWYLRAQRDRPDEQTAAAAAKKLRRLLRDGPMRRAKIMAELGGGATLFNSVGMFLDLVRVPPSGTWDHRPADLFAAAEDWVGKPGVTAADGLERLVRRYLGGFGPASPDDVANYVGLPRKTVAPVLDRVATRRFLDEQGKELVDLPRTPLPDPDTPAPSRFLPTWDSTLLAHARRTGILPEAHRSKVFSTKTPQSIPTFLVDGFVAGSWRYEHGRVRISPFDRLDRDTRRALDAEAEGLAAFHA